MHIHKAIGALKIKVALKIQMSFCKLSRKVRAAGGDGGVSRTRRCVCVCVGFFLFFFLNDGGSSMTREQLGLG